MLYGKSSVVVLKLRICRSCISVSRLSILSSLWGYRIVFHSFFQWIINLANSWDHMHYISLPLKVTPRQSVLHQIRGDVVSHVCRTVLYQFRSSKLACINPEANPHQHSINFPGHYSCNSLGLQLKFGRRHQTLVWDNRQQQNPEKSTLSKKLHNSWSFLRVSDIRYLVRLPTQDNKPRFQGVHHCIEHTRSLSHPQPYSFTRPLTSFIPSHLIQLALCLGSCIRVTDAHFR